MFLRLYCTGVPLASNIKAESATTVTGLSAVKGEYLLLALMNVQGNKAELIVFPGSTKNWGPQRYSDINRLQVCQECPH